MDPINQFKQSAQKTINSLKEELKSIRTGRASPSLVENIIVDTYGGTAQLRLLEVATITTGGPSSLIIVPFDSATTSDIEKSILKSPLGISPQVQGNQIILKIPSLSEEQRDKFVKLAGTKVEEHKNVIRNMRDNARKTIKTSFENKEITEDEKFRMEKQIDESTQRYMEEIQSLKERKETEIREI